MSFEKAQQLLELARMAAAYRMGITYADVKARFGGSERTHQRLMQVLEYNFPETESFTDDEGRKRWRLAAAALNSLDGLNSDELAALDLAMKALNGTQEAKHLLALKEKIMRALPDKKARRLETDHEAMLEAQGFAARPGPKPRVNPEVISEISEAIKACLMLEIEYQGRADAEPRKRVVAPLGILLGLRRYIVALPAEDLAGAPRSFRADAIRSAKVTVQSFKRPADFDLQSFAHRAFGTYQNEKEYGEVVWRFKPEAAANARDFEFHPDQIFEDQPDGSLIVRFQAAGHLEMCWYLYSWGDKVEVLAPEGLRKMTEAFLRKDFPALP